MDSGTAAPGGAAGAGAASRSASAPRPARAAPPASPHPQQQQQQQQQQVADKVMALSQTLQQITAEVSRGAGPAHRNGPPTSLLSPRAAVPATAAPPAAPSSSSKAAAAALAVREPTSLLANAGGGRAVGGGDGKAAAGGVEQAVRQATHELEAMMVRLERTRAGGVGDGAAGAARVSFPPSKHVASTGVPRSDRVCVRSCGAQGRRRRRPGPSCGARRTAPNRPPRPANRRHRRRRRRLATASSPATTASSPTCSACRGSWSGTAGWRSLGQPTPNRSRPALPPPPRLRLRRHCRRAGRRGLAERRLRSHRPTPR